MIKAIWAFRNCKEKISNVDLILSAFSVLMWKRWHPDHKTKVYLDPDYFSTFVELDILYLWDSFEILTHVNDVNIKEFWAFSKIEAIEKEEGPFVLLDGDIIALSNLGTFGFFNHELSLPLIENCKGSESIAYGNPAEMAEFGGIIPDTFDWNDYADNTSIVFWNHPELKDRYVKMASEYIKICSTKDLGEFPLKYLLFAEQKLIHELSRSMKVDKKYLIKDSHIVATGYSELNIVNGSFSLQDSYNFIIHYGPSKAIFKDPVEMKNHLDEFIIPLIEPRFHDAFWRIYNREQITQIDDSTKS